MRQLSNILVVAFICLLLVSCGGRAKLDPSAAPLDSTSAALTWLMVVSTIGVGLSIAAIVLLSQFAPPLRWIGIAGVACFGSIFALAILTSSLLPWLPYIAIGAMVILGGVALYYVRKHLDYTPKEAQLIVDLATNKPSEVSHEAKQFLEKLLPKANKNPL